MIIEASRVVKKFGDFTAIREISLAVKKGEIVGFVGANGAGKTTTISMLLGFISPSSGEVKLFGKAAHASSLHKSHKKIGYAAGDMELPPRLTGRQYLSFVLSQNGGSHEGRHKELVKRFQPVLDRKIKQLSRGNKQKIALIAAFVTEPELVILDEPTSGLDPVMQEVFLDLVREEREKGTTVFMSSHYLNEVADVCSRVILMRSGKIIEDVSSKELLTRSGKNVRVVTGYKTTRPPKDAEDTAIETVNAQTVITFIFKGDPGDLQRWLAGVKQLRDVEVTEYNLEGAFKSMYVDEEKTV